MHDLVKHVIDKCKDLAAASEIIAKLNELMFFSLLLISMIFFKKQLRPCQSETVNTLLNIPYHKHIMTAFGFFGYTP